MFRRDFLRISGSVLITPSLLTAWGIDPIDPGAPLSRALFINCLQRTQTQQLLKKYIMAALGSSYKDPKRTLPGTVEQYDRRFRLLYDYFMSRINDAEARQKMEQAKRLWEESKQMLLSKPSKTNALKLQSNFKKMIHLLSAPKVLNTKKSFKAVAKTGGLCRDPLYMANLYLMKLWGVDIPDYEEQMKKYIHHFRTNLAFLETYPKNTPEIKQLLKQAGTYFIFFEMMYHQSHTAIPTLISQKADDIFQRIQKIKQLYGKML